MKNHRIPLAAAASVALMMTLAGCSGTSPSSSLAGGTAETGTPVSGGVLTVADADQPLSGLDPVMAQSFNSKRLAAQFYEGLLSINADGTELLPGLATSWTAESKTEYLFTLRKGATFHDGKSVTANDVVYSLKRIVDPATASPYASLYSIAAVSAVDEQTVRVKLSSPQASLLRLLAQPWSGGIVEKDWTESHSAAERKTQENGTGPYRLKSYAEGSLIETVAYDGYWDAPKPYIDQVNYRVIADESTLVQSLTSKSVDAGQVKQPTSVQTLQKSGLTVGKTAATGVQWMAMNTLDGPLADVRVRRAFSLALDRNKINQISTLGTGQLSAVVPPGDPLGCTVDASTPYAAQNIDEAKRLLAEAGTPAVTVSIKVGSNNALAIKAVQLMKEQLSAVGITLDIQTVAFEDLVSSVLSDDWGADMVNLVSTLNADASQYVALWFAKGSATTKVEDAKLTTLMTDAKSVPTTDEARKAAYQKTCDYVADQVFMVTPFAAPTVNDVWSSSRLHGFTPDVTGTRLFLKDAWVSE